MSTTPDTTQHTEDESALAHVVSAPERLVQRLVPADLPRVLANLVEVAAWTSRDGHWQEHASFLLGTGDDHWHVVDFSAPLASEVVPRLLGLPGFRADRLLELVGSRTERVVGLWARTA
ncbi:hypothetical protein [Pseudonocardia spinosispora]|uniref:hypothetical protein n=1 Tax=Pseudonocardia spinosispora TaxID=103441 RepID=UPI00040B2733|nr:hypothetical protein [Pseudonocardia spinosispora]